MGKSVGGSQILQRTLLEEFEILNSQFEIRNSEF